MKYFITFLIFISFLNCFGQEKDIWNRINEKVEWFKTNTKSNIDINNIPKAFLMFYTDFLSDSIKQKTRIEFNDFIGVLGECDTTIRLNSNNWEYTSWNFLDHFDFKNSLDNYEDNTWNNTFFYSEKIFFYEFVLNGSGTIYQVGFEKKENDWKMTLYYINNC